MVADELRLGLEDACATVVGPTATVQDTLDLIASEHMLDGVILDVNLGGTTSYAAADQLMADSIPFIFTTGYDAKSIPGRFSHITRCEKPVSVSQLVRAIGRAACS